MKILAIRFARLGDVLLLLPALRSLKEKFPDSQLVFLTGHRCAPVAQMCSFIDQVISVDRIAMRDGPLLKAIRDMTALVKTVRKGRFDFVIDFHSFRETNLLTWFSGAPKRLGLKRHQAAYWSFCFNQPPVFEDKSIHVADMFQRVVGGNRSSGRVLTIPGAAQDPKKLVLYVDAPVADRVWPAEGFAAVADFAVERLNADVLIISSPEGASRALKVRDASVHSRRLGVNTNLSLPDLAATIASARLLVSNDTGPMHIGPAVGVPTLGLFSVGYPEHFRPIGPNDRYLRANPIEKIETRDVIANVEEMWVMAGRDLRR
ncbi:MAG TPA: glycosyltransferase family 9 protein [Terriglobia bacterium]|nr:glycosyltransferase family 9 protein [Terriglobia bacterium]